MDLHPSVVPMDSRSRALLLRAIIGTHKKGSAEEGPAAATYWRVPFGVSPSISLMFLGAQEETPAELRSLAMSPINNKL